MKPNPIIVAGIIHDMAGRQSAVGNILDCAMQNAGFDGRHVHDLDHAESAELVRHIEGIVDMRAVGDSAEPSQYAALARILAGETA